MPAFEHRVLIPAAAPAEVFAFMSRAVNVPHFAPGIDEAHLLGGADGLQGAFLGLRTTAGRELRAQITHYHEGESWTVVDERDTVSQIQVEGVAGGTLVTATLSGSWRPERQRRVLAEWQRKLDDLPALLRPAATPMAR